MEVFRAQDGCGLRSRYPFPSFVPSLIEHSYTPPRLSSLASDLLYPSLNYLSPSVHICLFHQRNHQSNSFCRPFYPSLSFCPFPLINRRRRIPILLLQGIFLVSPSILCSFGVFPLAFMSILRPSATQRPGVVLLLHNSTGLGVFFCPHFSPLVP
jgi:hypothetical protein